MNACLLYVNFERISFLGTLPENSLAILMVQAIREMLSLMKAEFFSTTLFLIALKSRRRSFRAILAHHVKEGKVTLQTSRTEGTSRALCGLIFVVF